MSGNKKLTSDIPKKVTVVLYMNNTKSILLVAIIAATLIMGTSVIPMQSYADRDNKRTKKQGL